MFVGDITWPPTLSVGLIYAHYCVKGISNTGPFVLNFVETLDPLNNG